MCEDPVSCCLRRRVVRTPRLAGLDADGHVYCEIAAWFGSPIKLRDLQRGTRFVEEELRLALQGGIGWKEKRRSTTVQV